MPKWHIIGSIYHVTGFEALIEAPTEDKARAQAQSLAEAQGGTDMHEFCVESVTLVAQPTPDAAIAEDPTTALLERLLSVVKRQGRWVMCGESKAVGNDIFVVPEGYYDMGWPPKGYQAVGPIGLAWAQGDLIPVYWDDNPEATPISRLIEVEQMLLDLLQQRQAEGTP